MFIVPLPDMSMPAIFAGCFSLWSGLVEGICMCPASAGGAGLGDAEGICISGISFFGGSVTGVAAGAGEGVGDADVIGGLLAGILWP